jgi:hypothetical protein
MSSSRTPSTLSRDAMLELMAYADGELEGADLARVEALVASSDEARRIVQSMGGVAEWVRVADAESPRREATHRMADGIAVAVMAQIAMSAAAIPGSPASPSISLDAARARRASRRYPAPGRLAAAGAGLLALAAGTVLFLRTSGPGVDARHAAHTKATKSVVAQAEGPSIGPLPGSVAANAGVESVAQNGADDVSGVDVEQVESPSHQVSVFYLPAVAAAAAGSNASSVVVWIGDDKAPGGL